mmetsp:Transcript_35523/g.82937  ORF Transcript_35523/g.82937 Transcript_35523/m.82937 type:complete len:99 (+) Transcript_35523:57-353(+)
MPQLPTSQADVKAGKRVPKVYAQAQAPKSDSDLIDGRSHKRSVFQHVLGHQSSGEGFGAVQPHVCGQNIDAGRRWLCMQAVLAIQLIELTKEQLPSAP